MCPYFRAVKSSSLLPRCLLHSQKSLIIFWLAFSWVLLHAGGCYSPVDKLMALQCKKPSGYLHVWDDLLFLIINLLLWLFQVNPAINIPKPLKCNPITQSPNSAPVPLLVAQSGRSLQPLLQQLCNSVTKWPWAVLVVASCWGAHPASTGLDAGRSMKLLDEGVEKLIDFIFPCS